MEQGHTSGFAQKLGVVLLSLAALPALVGCGTKEQLEPQSHEDASAEFIKINSADTIHLDELEARSPELRSMVDTLKDGYKNTLLAEKLLRTNIRRDGGAQSVVALYSNAYSESRHIIERSLNEVQQEVRKALENPALKEDRWHLYPLAIRLEMVSELIENGELVKGRPEAYRSSIDGNAHHAAGLREAMLITLGQLTVD